MTITDFDREAPFGAVFLAWAHDTRRSLDVPDTLFTAEAMDQLESSLAHRLAKAGGRALLAMMESASRGADGSYERFVAHVLTGAGQHEIDVSFPVLTQLRREICRQWTDSVSDLLGALVSDVDLLADALGKDGRWLPIVNVRSGLGDSHRDGRTVMGLGPAFGRSVAFKPRPFAAEAGLYDILGRVIGTSLDDERRLWAVDRGTHGWMAWIRSGPVTDRAEYWRNAGRAAAILHIGGAVDLHHGNMLVAGNACVPVDLECSNTPILDIADEQGAAGLDSVLATGLFPGWFGQDGPVAREVCGLFGQGGRTAGLWYTSWSGLGTDAIRMERRIGFDPPSENFPCDASGKQLAVDLDALLDGLESTLEVVADGRYFDGLGDPPSRVLFRGTGMYATLIHSMLDADALADPTRFATLSQSLPDFDDNDWRQRALGAAGVAALRSSETRALRRLDIPLFRARGRDVELDDGIVLADVLPGSGAERRARRLARLDRGGIARQRAVVSLAVEQYARVYPSPRPRAVAREPEPVGAAAAAVRIGEELLSERYGDASCPTWLELEQGSSRRTSIAGTSATDLYGGSDGIACFFACLAVLTGEDRWSVAARRALWSAAPEAQRRPGWPSGAAGHIYARLYVGRLLGDEQLLATAVDELAAILSLDPGASPKLDLVDGWPGLLAVAMTAISSGLGTAAVRSEANTLADHLCTAAVEQWNDEVAARPLRAISMAHGGTGLAFVLLRAARTLNNVHAATVGRLLVKAENEKVELRGGIGAALTQHGGRKVARPGWCWGAAGFLLARLSAASETAPDLLNERHMSLTLAAMTDPVECRSGLCCGQAGSLVAAQEAARRGVPNAAELEKSLTSVLIDQVAGESPFRFVPPLSFAGASLFMGRAGVGYALVRVAAPDAIPNILTVE